MLVTADAVAEHEEKDREQTFRHTNVRSDAGGGAGRWARLLAREAEQGAAAAKVGASLVVRKLMREVRAKPGMPVWRIDGDRAFGLMITREGRKAVTSSAEVIEATDAAQVPQQDRTVGGAMEVARVTLPAADGPAPRSGTKQALLVDMLAAEGGTTLEALAAATGWLPHTTRAALTGLRKKGFAIARQRSDGQPSVYRLADQPVADAA